MHPIYYIIYIKFNISQTLRENNKAQSKTQQTFSANSKATKL